MFSKNLILSYRIVTTWVFQIRGEKESEILMEGIFLPGE